MDTLSLPIALFDSGVGGLTVFKSLAATLPHEDLIYLGDTARLPYGTKGAETIVRYTLLAARKLVSMGIKMLVVACNTATSAALPTLQEHFSPLPVIGVVEPGAQAAAKATRNGNILVIATEATIKGRAYQLAIERIMPAARVSGRACTLFVPIAEEGWMSGELVEGVAHRYLDEFFTDSHANDMPDTLLLGCTHFPLLKQALANVVGPGVTIVDSALATACHVKVRLEELGLLRPSGHSGEHSFMTTDNVERFARTGGLFLGKALDENTLALVDL